MQSKKIMNEKADKKVNIIVKKEPVFKPKARGNRYAVGSVKKEII